MKSKVNKIVISALLVLCMAVSMFFVAGKAEAADLPACTEHTTYTTKEYTGAQVANYRKGNQYQIPETDDGYLFAGWYKETDCSTANALREEDEIVSGNTYYAKYVPEHVADVKAQLSINLITEDGNKDSGKIRFVTTVDSLNYQESGFYISYNGNTIKNTSNTVYTEIVATDMNGSSATSEPNVFCGISQYFRACTIKNVSNKSYAIQFDVQAFWVTLDGTKVVGPEVSKQVEDGLLKDVKYVSSNGSDENAGTEASPYLTLEKAVAEVAAHGKIVINDTCEVSATEKIYTIPATTTDGTATEEKETAVTIADSDNSKDKNLTITGGKLIFTGATEIHLGDSVKFEDIQLIFGESTSLYANGYTLEIAQSATLSDHSATGNNHSKNLTVYGGSRDAEITGDTNLILRAGTYANIYGGGRVSVTGNSKLNGYVNGNTNIVIGGTVNQGKTYNSDHDIDDGLNVFGGGATGRSAIRGTGKGNTNITIESDKNSFQYVYGGSRNTHIVGVATINFQGGKAMSLFGGGYYGEAQGDTYVIMTGGEVEQVFGGAQSMNVKANTNVQILGGKVTRRVYGGSYNNYTWGKTLYSVTGNTNVMISPNATLSFEKGYIDTEDHALCAVSRYKEFFANEWGVFILNEDAMFSDKIGGFAIAGSNNDSHHYMVKTNGNAAAGSLGTVSPQGKYIHIEPKAGYSATVYQGTSSSGTELHYTESESIFELPALSAKTDSMDIYVEFAAKTDKTDYEAKTGQAYYTTLEKAIDIAYEMYANREKKVADETIVVTLLADKEMTEPLKITNNMNLTLAGDTATRTIYRGSEFSQASLVTVAEGAAFAMDSLVIDGRTEDEAKASTVTASSAGSRYELMKNSGTLTLKNTTFQNVNHNSSSALESGRQEHGGVLYATDKSDTTIIDCAFNDNYTGELGTVLFVNSSSKVDITGSQFDGNAAPNRSAGVIYAYGATVTATNCDFTNNTAKYNGGAVNSTNTTLTMTGCTFDKNTIDGTDAMRPAGAVYIAQTGTATIDDCTFTDNTAYYYGGALYAVGNSTDVCEVEIKNSTFNNNAVSNTFHVSTTTNADGTTKETTDGSGSRGGAVFLTKVNATVSDTSFSENTARRGGGVCVDQSITEFNNCTFEGNAPTTAQAYGAAMYINGINTTTINGSTFKNNTGKNNGGAISIYGNSKTNTIVNVNDTDFSENKTPSAWGGAMYVQKATANVCNTNFVSNESNNGGAIGVEQNGIVNVSADKEGRGLFTQNYAKKQGGAIRSYLSGAAKNTFVIGITGCTFDLNHADANGGAIGADQGTTLDVTNTAFNDNYSNGGNGGAISATSSNCTVNVKTGTSFEGNYANTSAKTGGALYVDYSATANVTATSFTSNSAYKGGAIGVGIEAGKTGTVNVSADTTFTSNRAATVGGEEVTYAEGNVGGAIYVATGTANVANATFTTNQAYMGGAVGSSEDGTIKITNDGGACEFKENSATNLGGAISTHIADAASNAVFDVQVTGATFNTNYAANDGGAIHVGEGTGATVDSCEFKGNYATANRGGAIFVLGKEPTEETFNASLVVQGATNFTDNTATKNYGGAIYVGYATANITDANFTNNQALNGGAIGSQLKSDITVSAQTTGRGVFQGNNVTNQGGAIRTYSDGSTLGTFDVQVTGCIFADNTASANAGAIGADQGTKLEIDNCEFKDIDDVQKGSTKILGNKAGGQGGAIAVTGAMVASTEGGSTAANASAFINNSKFNNNNAKGGGALYVCIGTLRVENSYLTDNASVNSTDNLSGGAVLAGGYNKGASATNTQATFTNTSFTNNQSNKRGGAIQTMDSTLKVENSSFTGNKSTGGNGGAICASNNSVVAVYSNNNSSFSNNETTAMGGALYNGGNGTMTVEGYTFTGNKTISTNATYQKGHAIYFNISTNDKFYVKNCVFNAKQGVYDKNTKKDYTAEALGNTFNQATE